MATLGPRVVIAGTHSGVGKTTVATGLMAALRAKGVRVAAAKVGPDFIDPGYHALATGRPSRNLDPWMSGLSSVTALAGRAGDGADLLVVEGVMGLFDGAADGTPSSTAEVAVALDAPVVLVVDASSASTSVAAVVHGFDRFDPRLRIAGIVMNRVASDSHEQMLRDAIRPLGIPVLGTIRRDDDLTWRDRHLGLIPVVEQRAAVEASLLRLAATIARSCALDAFVAIAGRAPTISTAAAPLPSHVADVRVAVATGSAFSFSYPDNLEALAAAGAELVPFDPCVDEQLPEGCAGLVAGGGFPEVYVDALSANTRLLADVRRHITANLVVWAECGGLLWLTTSLDERPLAGVIDARATMTSRLTLGYRRATATTDTPICTAGTELRGHEYHYSSVTPEGGAFSLHGRHGPSTGGFATPQLVASYLHVHLGASPEVASRFVETCHRARTALPLPYVG